MSIEIRIMKSVQKSLKRYFGGYRKKNVYYCVVRRWPLRLLLCDLVLSNLPKSTKWMHPYGISINRDVVMGENCLIMQNVTIGKKELMGSHPVPEIGNNVILCAGCVVLGGIKIGDDVIVGANAVVLNDIPSGCMAVGVPARIIKKGENDGCKNAK